MLDPADLRIGNWVLMVNGTDRNSKTFLEYRPIAANEYFYSSARCCFPIKITPDVLGKSGFKHDFGDWYKNIEAEGIDDGMPFLRYKQKEKCWYLKGMKIPAQPRYLHELQNLVYALMHVELKVQLGTYNKLLFIASDNTPQKRFAGNVAF